MLNLVPMHSSVTNFSQNLFISFFLKFCTAIEIQEQKKVAEAGFTEKKFVCPKICKKRLKWRFFFSFHKILLLNYSHLFSCVKLIILKILVHKLYRPICSHPIRLQNSLIINVSGSKVSVSLIFCMEIFTKKKQHVRLLPFIRSAETCPAMLKHAQNYQGSLQEVFGAFLGKNNSE